MYRGAVRTSRRPACRLGKKEIGRSEPQNRVEVHAAEVDAEVDAAEVDAGQILGSAAKHLHAHRGSVHGVWKVSCVQTPVYCPRRACESFLEGLVESRRIIVPASHSGAHLVGLVSVFCKNKRQSSSSQAGCWSNERAALIHGCPSARCGAWALCLSRLLPHEGSSLVLTTEALGLKLTRFLAARTVRQTAPRRSRACRPGPAGIGEGA